MASLSNATPGSLLRNVVQGLVALGLSLQALGAVYQPVTLGYLAASPGTPILLIASVLSLFFLRRGSLAFYAWLMILWGVAASAISIVWFGAETLYVEKTVALLVLTIAWSSPILCIGLLTPKSAMFAASTALAICLVAYVASDVFPDILPAGLKAVIFGGGYGTYIDERPRGFMTETSHFGSIIARYGLVVFLLVERRRPYAASRLLGRSSLLGFALFLVGSKGSILSMAFSLAVASFKRGRLPIILTVVPLALVFASTQVDALGSDFTSFTSTATRTTLFLTSIGAFLSNPFGYGYYGFYPAIHNFGSWALDIVSGSGLNLREVELIIYNLENVSTKSTITDYAVIFGVTFVLFMITALRRIQLSDPRALFATIFLLSSGLSTSGTESISFFFLLAVLVRFYGVGQANDMVRRPS